MSSPQLAVPHVAASQNQKEVTINGGFDALDNAVNRGLDVSVSAASATLTNAEFRGHGVFRVTGATVAGRTVTVPAIARVFIVRSDAANTEAIGVVRGTSSVVLAPGQLATFRTDGTANGLALVARGEPRSNLAGTVDPTATDDAAAGFEVGSRWWNGTTNRLWFCAAATVGAADWRPVLERERVGYIAGTWYAAIEATTRAAAAVLVDTMYLCPLVADRSVSVDALGLHLVTGAASSNVRVGLYSSDAAGLPAELIAESTDQSTATNGTNIVGPITATSLVAGRMYYGAAVFSDAVSPDQFASAGVAAGGISAQLGYSAPRVTGAGLQNARITRTAGVTYVAGSPFLPATVGAVTIGGGAPASPIMFWRAA